MRDLMRKVCFDVKYGVASERYMLFVLWGTEMSIGLYFRVYWFIINLLSRRICEQSH